jgi:hypothetical protein
MSLTKNQWFDKVKSLVQSWVVQEDNAKSIFMGVAAALEQAEKDYLNHIDQTFIDSSELEYVQLHGDERSVIKLDDESIHSYRNRVKRITNQSNIPDIKAIVDALLIRGKSTLIEHTNQSGAFLDRGFALNRDIIDYDVLYNAFTVLIDYQIPEPNAFLNREAFTDREFLNGSITSSDTVFENVIKAINQNKAFGVVYRLIERVN